MNSIVLTFMHSEGDSDRHSVFHDVNTCEWTFTATTTNVLDILIYMPSLSEKSLMFDRAVLLSSAF